MKYTTNYLNCTKEVLDTLLLANTLAKQLNSPEITIYHIYIALLNTPTIKILLKLYLPTLYMYVQKYNIIEYTQLTFIPFNTYIILLLNTEKSKNTILNTIILLKTLINLKINSTETTYKLYGSHEILSVLNKLLETPEKKKKVTFNSILTTIAYNITKKRISVSKYLEKKKDISKICDILQRNSQNNPILIGEPGIGKRTIIKSFLANIKSKHNLGFKEVWIINPYILCEAQNKLELLFKSLLYVIPQTEKHLLIIPDFQYLFKNITEQDQTETSFTHILRILLTKKNIQILGTTTQTYFKRINNVFKESFLFESIQVTPLTKSEQIHILKNISKQIETQKNIKIKEILLYKIYDLAKKYLYFSAPKKNIFLLETSTANLKANTTLTLKDIQKSLSTLVNLPKTFIITRSKLTDNLLNIETNLNKKVYGQETAITKISNIIHKTNLGLKQSNKPIGSWFFCGFSGTGKTELAKSLAECLFGSNSNILRFDMSEFMEKHSVARLIGSPPGYVGYSEGGQLTGAIKKTPYTLILFDEIEKAHPDITNILLQVLDDGRLTDSKGDVINFSNTLIIFTSNLGCPKTINEFTSFKLGTEFTSNEYEILSKKINLTIKQHFKPEFLNRLDDILIFKPLDIDKLKIIFTKFLTEIKTSLKHRQLPILLDISPKVQHIIATLSYQPLYGARPLKRLMNKFIEKPLSDILINTKLTRPHIFSIYFDNVVSKFQYTLTRKN